MDHKTWLWRKKSAEKTITPNDLASLSTNGNEDQQVQAVFIDKAEYEKDIKNLTEKLSSVISDCNLKDDLVKKHEKMAQEALVGREKAETEVASLKKRLDESQKLKIAGEERIAHLDATLKECTQQLQFVREEQEQRIHDAVVKTLRDFEQSQAALEERLEETSKRLAKMGVENAHISKSLLSKERLIENLTKQMKQAEAEASLLVARLDSMEKANASLKYEVRILEKELEIRNEEREFNQRSADASHKQHLDSVKKIAKLESECQRLRLLVQKRLPGPAAVAKMKNEVEMLGRGSIGLGKMNAVVGPMADFVVDKYPEMPTKKINFLTEQLIALQEDNKALKRALNKKVSELQASKVVSGRAMSKFSQEPLIEGSPKSQKSVELPRSLDVSLEHSFGSISDMGSDDKASSSESWASALISELENFRSEKKKDSVSSKRFGVSDITLMDDFVEMEKLATVSAAEPYKICSLPSLQFTKLNSPFKAVSCGTYSEVTSVNEVFHSKSISTGKIPCWIQEIVKIVLDQNQANKRNVDDLLEEVKMVLARGICEETSDLNNLKDSIDGRADISKESFDVPSTKQHWNNDPLISEKGKVKDKSDISKSISKFVELVESISLSSDSYDKTEALPRNGGILSSKTPEGSTDYTVRVFQWKSSTLSAVLQDLLHTCYDCLNEKADLSKLLKESVSALEWILNHCFSLKDVSSMRYEILKGFDWEDSRSESEAELGIIRQLSDPDKLCTSIAKISSIQGTCENSNNGVGHLEEVHGDLMAENRKLRENLMSVGSTKESLEVQLQSVIGEKETLMHQIEASRRTMESLHTQLNSLKESTGLAEDQIENHKLVSEDLDRQLAEAKVELNEAHQKFCSLEVELENKNNCCEELEATCLDLQLQLESVKNDNTQNRDLNLEEKQHQPNWELAAASEKLAECQETILNLGKQLKALASPKDATLFDKIAPNITEAINSDTTDLTKAIVPVSSKRNFNPRASLLDQMMAEDSAKVKDLNSYSPTKVMGISVPSIENGLMIPVGAKSLKGDERVGSLSIVPLKKQGVGHLWRRLLWRKKKSNKIPTLPLKK